MAAQVWDPYDDNLDVRVHLTTGAVYCGTFVTMRNLDRLFAKNRTTGECAGGLYFWAENMIVVEILTMDVITRAVEDLLEVGELEEALHLLRE
jgi:hypothetical protein